MIRFAALLVAVPMLAVSLPAAADGIAPAPSAPPPPVFAWMPGHWTWNGPMSAHVWVPGMYIRPSTAEEQRDMALWRLGKWIGIGRQD